MMRKGKAKKIQTANAPRMDKLARCVVRGAKEANLILETRAPGKSSGAGAERGKECER
jgi:hypothetical protein